MPNNCDHNKMERRAEKKCSRTPAAWTASFNTFKTQQILILYKVYSLRCNTVHNLRQLIIYLNNIFK